ncbi:MAG: hypothetical protein JWP12_3351 [Bacteroidetes bacterium]|nr:hypothetical protein [Bacteroidota bacterium]
MRSRNKCGMTASSDNYYSNEHLRAAFIQIRIYSIKRFAAIRNKKKRREINRGAFE